ncbi:MAG TPA: chorismate mutase [Patescibacteria group bacterium]|nr:chorismate mutase [Patescibacteria group bacterium]
MGREILNDLRIQIDENDVALVSIISKRIELVKKVGILKKENKIIPLDQNRWDKVIKNRIEIGRKLGLSEKLILDIFERLHEESLTIESQIIEEINDL